MYVWPKFSLEVLVDGFNITIYDVSNCASLQAFEDAEMLIGNLPVDISDEELLEFLAEVGEVESVQILRDAAGRGRGFAFVSIASTKQRQQAMLTLQNCEFKGRILTISEAQQRSKNKETSFWSELFRFNK